MSGIDGEGSTDDVLARTTTRQVFGGLLWSVIANLASPLLVLGTSIAAARFLGPADMGRQSFIAFTALSVSLVLSAGVSGAVQRFVGHSLASGRGPALRGALRIIARWQIAIGLLVLAGLSAYGSTKATPALQASWALAGAVAALTVVQTLPSSVLVGAQQWRRAGMTGLITSAVGTVVTVVVLAAGGGIVGMFAVEVVAVAVNLVWITVRAVREVHRLVPVAADPDGLVREIARFAAVGSVQVVLAYFVWQRSEFFFLAHYSGPVQIAIYSIAFASAMAVQRLLEAVSSALHPALATLLGAGEHERIRVAVGRALRLLALLTPPLVIGLMVVAPRGLLLLYGDEYAATGRVVVLLLAVLPLVTMSRVAAATLHVFGRLRAIVGCLMVATVIDVLACLLLVPSLDARGAALANIAAQGVAALLEIGLLVRVIGRIDWEAPRLVAGLLSGAAAGAAGWAVISVVSGAAGLVAAGAACLLGYVAAAAVLRPFPGADIDWLERGAGERLGGAIGRVCRAVRHIAAPSASPSAVPGGG